MSDNYLFKIPTQRIIGSTTSAGSSLYVYLSPGEPVKFSVDGGGSVFKTADLGYKQTVNARLQRLETATAARSDKDLEQDTKLKQLQGELSRISGSILAISSMSAKQRLGLSYSTE